MDKTMTAVANSNLGTTILMDESGICAVITPKTVLDGRLQIGHRIRGPFDGDYGFFFSAENLTQNRPIHVYLEYFDLQLRVAVIELLSFSGTTAVYTRRNRFISNVPGAANQIVEDILAG